MGRRRPASGLLLALVALALAPACRRGAAVDETRVVPSPTSLADHCREAIGDPRVEEVAPGIFVAIGYDLANTILVHTPDGNVVIDAMMGPERAARAREALLARAPGPTRALIFTHSHIDHVGGASVWIEEGTEVWATAAFMPHFIKQYGVFNRAETARGTRQFGRQVDAASLPCSALGARPSLEGDVGGGVRAPTRTFRGDASFVVGGVTFELHEAHGETDDQLFVWLPDRRALMPGDNIYRAFPNLYTIRGTRPRPVDRWVKSLDAMRRLRPQVLAPSHTAPVRGEAAVEDALRNYRDAIAYVYAAVVRGANAGEGIDAMAARIGLPRHLAEDPWLRELYGQVDWSVRAIYGGELGWFDGQPEGLYTLSPADLAKKEIAMMGGAEAVQAAVDRELAGDPRFAAHLLRRLQESGLLGDAGAAWIAEREARALRGIAAGVANTNGRGYLLQSAIEREEGAPEAVRAQVDDALLAAIPVEVFFDAMPPRLRLDEAAEVHESLAVRLEDRGLTVTITVRRGVVEVVYGDPLPGTPTPVATMITDSLTWKRLALRLTTPAAALTSGLLKIDGEALGARRFLDRFDRGL
ncbi:MAG: alkyl sulfatase dimerization domain-containing protein [Nannocystaceae bacterium]